MSRRRGHAELITWVVQRKPLSRNETDKGDARLLALFAQRAGLELWQPPSPAVRELHALVERGSECTFPIASNAWGGKLDSDPNLTGAAHPGKRENVISPRFSRAT
jgi:hypothetical protein